jgi:hypothetical protein
LKTNKDLQIPKIFNNNLNNLKNYLKQKIRQEMQKNIKILTKELRLNHILISISQKIPQHKFKNLTDNIRKWYNIHKILEKVDWNT